MSKNENKLLFLAGKFRYLPLSDQFSNHKETDVFICDINQLIGFYICEILVLNGLPKMNTGFGLSFSTF